MIVCDLFWQVGFVAPETFRGVKGKRAEGKQRRGEWNVVGVRQHVYYHPRRGTVQAPQRRDAAVFHAIPALASGVIVGIQPHVLGRQIGSPKAPLGRAFAELELDERVAVVADRRGYRSAVELDRGALLVQQEPIQA